MELYHIVFIYIFIIMIIEIGLGFRTLFKFKDNELDDSDFKPFVSILIPAYNEEKSIISSIKGALNQNYDNFEVIVIDDGSTDNTLQNAIDFREENKIPISKLRILHKENGGKFSALNYGMEEAEGDWILSVDADSFIIPQTISTLIKKKRKNAVAVTTGIGVVNNCDIVNGELIKKKVPNKPLVVSQMIEYLRTFVLLKMSLNDKNGTTVMSGVCGFFEKEFIQNIGGYKDKLTEDSELTLRIHKNGGNVQFISDILSYTEVPSSIKELHKQRMRWIRGIFRDLWEYRTTVKTNSIRWFLLPYYFIVHYILPWVEIGGWIAMMITMLFYPIGLYLSIYILSVVYIMYFINTMFIMSVGLSKMKLLNEYEGKWKLFVFSAIDVFYYRPVLLFFTIKAQIMEFFQKKIKWEKIKRVGF